MEGIAEWISAKREHNLRDRGEARGADHRPAHRRSSLPAWFPEPDHRSERRGPRAAYCVHPYVLGNIWAAENVKTGSVPRPSGDIIGERDPVKAYTVSADAMMASFDEPGALGRDGRVGPPQTFQPIRWPFARSGGGIRRTRRPPTFRRTGH
jgi:hypothetical protein